MQETQVQSLGWEDPLEKEMAPHSSKLAWKIPWTEEPGRLQPMGLQRVGHDWATSLSFTFNLLRKKGTYIKECAHYVHMISFFPHWRKMKQNIHRIFWKYIEAAPMSMWGCENDSILGKSNHLSSLQENKQAFTKHIRERGKIKGKVVTR